MTPRQTVEPPAMRQEPLPPPSMSPLEMGRRRDHSDPADERPLDKYTVRELRQRLKRSISIEDYRELAQLGSKMFPLIREAMQHGSLGVRIRAMRTLGWMGEEAVPLLIELFETRDSDLSRMGSQFGHVGSPAAVALKGVLYTAEKASTRAKAVTLLSEMSAYSEDATSVLLAALEHPDKRIRFVAALSVAPSNVPADKLVPVFVEILREHNRNDKECLLEGVPVDSARDSILMDLDFLAPRAASKPAIPVLQELANDNRLSAEERQEAAKVLREIQDAQ